MARTKTKATTTRKKKRGPGRPPGSKNKKVTKTRAKSGRPAVKKRGRPPASKGRGRPVSIDGGFMSQLDSYRQIINDAEKRTREISKEAEALIREQQKLQAEADEVGKKLAAFVAGAPSKPKHAASPKPARQVNGKRSKLRNVLEHVTQIGQSYRIRDLVDLAVNNGWETTSENPTVIMNNSVTKGASKDLFEKQEWGIYQRVAIGMAATPVVTPAPLPIEEPEEEFTEEEEESTQFEVGETMEEEEPEEVKA